MSGIVQWLDAKFYPDFQHRWDDQFLRERILAHLGGGELERCVGLRRAITVGWKAAT